MSLAEINGDMMKLLKGIALGFSFLFWSQKCYWNKFDKNNQFCQQCEIKNYAGLLTN